MSSWQARVFSRAIRALVRREDWGAEAALVARARRVLGAPRAYGYLATVGLSRRSVRTRAVRGEWLVPRRPRRGVVLYVHGGGFVSCSAATHRPITAALARLARRPVFGADYRLAPEARLPTAHEDVADTYRYLLDAGIPASEIALVGDSAGGNLVLSLAVQLRDRGEPAPACVVAFSPWTDLRGRSSSMGGDDDRCAMFHPGNRHDFAAAALGRGDPDSALVSPVHAALHDLPPVLLHVGSTELLLDDATRVHDAIRRSGGACTLHVFDDVPHGWQMLHPWMPEATTSLRETVSFIDAALARARSAGDGVCGEWTVGGIARRSASRFFLSWRRRRRTTCPGPTSVAASARVGRHRLRPRADAMASSVATHLMFTGDASAALELYAAVFPDFRVERMERYGAGDVGAPGTVRRADAVFGQHRIVAIDSPVKHAFSFTPSMSIFVDCDSAATLDAAFARLAEGGHVLMAIADYGFSQRFGWCTDRFGVSWQLNLP